MSLKFKTSQSVLGLGGLMVITACGAATTSKTMSPLCSKSPSVSSKKPSGQAPSSLNLSASQDQTQPAVGTGFLDIDSTDETGRKVTRRCTMTIRPIDTSDTAIRVWTAGHCAFEPHKAEFKNAKYTLQVYHNGGYFSVPAEVEGFSEFAKFSQALAPYLVVLTPEQKAQVFSAVPTMNTAPCLRDEATFKGNLGSRVKDVACFTRGELRGLKTIISPDKTSAPYVTEILSQLRTQNEEFTKIFSPNFRAVVQAYHASHFSELRRRADLRSFALNFNQLYCAEANKPPGTSTVIDATSIPTARQLCAARGQFLSLLSDNLPESDLKLMMDIINDNSSDINSLFARTKGCNGKNDETVTAETDVNALTPCDFGNIQFSFWRKWVDGGSSRIATASYRNQNLFGFNPDTYYSFTTNNRVNQQKANAPIVFKPQVTPLNLKSVLDLGLEVNKTDHFTILINYDKTKGAVNPQKGDSGSILSIFGSIPAALLSTVNGDATSGGASITPLPQVGEEEDIIPTRSKSNAGC
ncbi:MAG: hypothetical protein RI932_209 [Pseudomonadota bacterium]